MVNEIVSARIEQAQANLPSAVQATDGAHFRMLLSLIASNEMYGFEAKSEPGDFTLGEHEHKADYPDTESLHTPPVVDRMNRSVNEGATGELAYALSWVDTLAHTPKGRLTAGDTLARTALSVSGKMMLSELAKSQAQMA